MVGSALAAIWPERNLDGVEMIIFGGRFLPPAGESTTASATTRSNRSTWTPYRARNGPRTTAYFPYTRFWNGHGHVGLGRGEDDGLFFNTGGRLQPCDDTWLPNLARRANLPSGRKRKTPPCGPDLK
jgi:hypothetical protein